jgi:uroporphyrinogen-III synthase
VSSRFAGLRLLVPSSRLGPNLLARRLGSLGAEAVAFPRLVAMPPTDRRPFDHAVRGLADYHRIVVVGRIAAEAVVRAGRRTGLPGLVAVGAGAVDGLRRSGIEPAAAPRLHTPHGIADEVAGGVGDTVLVLHEQSTPPVLADELRRRGFHVDDVAAFRIEPVADRVELRAVFGSIADGVAFANPSAVRVLFRLVASVGLDLARCFAVMPVFAVGPETAREARRFGLDPDHVSAGRLADLTGDLERLLSPRG